MMRRPGWWRRRGGGAEPGTVAGLPSERVVLLTRRGCHLCETALAVIEPIAAAAGHRVALVDIDENPEMVTRYGDLVPVVVVDGRVHATWRVQPQAFAAAIGAPGTEG